jgi:hypothetical protein
VREKEALHQRSFWGYILAGLLVALVSAFFTPVATRIDQAIGKPSNLGGAVTPSPSATPIKSDVNQAPDQFHTVQGFDSRKEQLAEQYDSFNSRFSAVEASLQQRMGDLESLSVKPQITASIQTTRADLAEARGALSRGEFDRAALRLKRVEVALKYLESL